MANTRGNTFSRGNLDYNFRDPLYWRHTIDQYALVDAPAQIDMALQVSGAKKLAVVGHSQVSTAASAACVGRRWRLCIRNDCCVSVRRQLPW
jgi:hypothetical protein